MRATSGTAKSAGHTEGEEGSRILLRALTLRTERRQHMESCGVWLATL